MTVWENLDLEGKYLGGPSRNPHWHIPRALHSLCGEIEAADILIHAHEPLLQHRVGGHKEATTELGIATACVVMTSLIAERAIKTLIAQTRPQDSPPRGHSLSELFGRHLPHAIQDEVQRTFESLPSFWPHYLETSTVQGVLRTTTSNFVDWRYTMEPKSVTGGLPMPLLKVAVAVTLAAIDRLTEWQRANNIAAPVS